MNQLVTRGIILSRTDYGEADRIITVLTPDHGKLRLMARGVRKVKSKLAGGIELFSVSDITFIRGKGEIGTLVSTRLVSHYGEIVKHIDRVQLGYELIKLLNKATEDQLEEEYFQLLEQTFEALNNPAIDPVLVRVWFEAQLLRISGHVPNLKTDATNQQLSAAGQYNFDLESMTLRPQPNGTMTSGHIKVLRLLFSHNRPGSLAQVQGLMSLVNDVQPIMRVMAQIHLCVA